MSCAATACTDVGAPCPAAGWTTLTSDVLRRLYVEEGLTTRDVVERVGGSPARVLSALRRNGIPGVPEGSAGRASIGSPPPTAGRHSSLGRYPSGSPASDLQPSARVGSIRASFPRTTTSSGDDSPLDLRHSTHTLRTAVRTKPRRRRSAAVSSGQQRTSGAGAKSLVEAAKGNPGQRRRRPDRGPARTTDQKVGGSNPSQRAREVQVTALRAATESSKASGFTGSRGRRRNRLAVRTRFIVDTVAPVPT